MADDNNFNDGLDDENDELDLTGDDAEETENEEDVDDLDDDEDGDDFDEEYGDEDAPAMNLAGAGLSHTISDEAGTRLDLTDIHGGALKPTDLSTEMKTSFLEYSMSVIVARALPDVRHGLKPVHRRCLYSMYMLDNTWNKKHLKSARIVGDVIGKYHPHGDTAVYDTIVRMAQPFSLRVPLVDGHGNFGSIDGDGAAAMRYTEVRMQRVTEEMLGDLEKDTVDMMKNFDETLDEPTVLPAKLPNLLLNGSSGIAVGMATNIPPHNLGEL